MPGIETRSWPALVGGLVLAIATLGCDAKVGDPCEAGKAACKDGKTELVCQKGKFVAAPCKGPKGCHVEAGKLHCDISGNAEGDLCSTDDEGSAQCRADKKSIVACEKGKYAFSPCRGPKGCEQKGDTATCDTSLGKAGDKCEGTGYACSVDRKSLLKCTSGKAVVDEKCPGKQTCKSAGNKVGCEQ